MNQKSSLKAGIVQFEVFLGEVSLNMQQAQKGLERLVAEGTELAVLPEMWSCGFDYPRLQQHAHATPHIIEQLSQIASQHHIIIAGSLPEMVDGKIYNTLFIIGKNGSVLSRYQKIHLFTPTYEHNYFAPGNTTVICPTDIGVLGPVICYDIRFPELIRSLTLKGIQILIVSAQWPAVRNDHWLTLLKARAIENQLFVIGANCCGTDPGLEYGGSSLIISPQGNILASLTNSAGTITANLDFSTLEEFRRLVPCLTERRPSVY